MKYYERVVIRILVVSMLGVAAVAQADFLDAGEGSFIALQVDRSGTIAVLRQIPAPTEANSPEGPISSSWSHPVCKNLDRAIFTQYFFGEAIILSSKAFERQYELLLSAASNNVPVRLFADPEKCHTQGWPLIRAVRLGFAGVDQGG